MTERDASDSLGPDASPATAPHGGRRLVLFLPGHDATDMEYHHGRFAHQAGRVADLWSFETETGPRHDEPGLPISGWTTRSHGQNWRQETDYAILRWDDIVVALDRRRDVVRLWRGLLALWEFILNGTAWRYFKATIRYGLFCLFPLGILLLFMIAGTLTGLIAAALAGLAWPSPVPGLIGWGAGIAVFLALFHQPGRRWRVHHALDDWHLARNYLHGRTPALDARLKEFADYLVRKVGDGDYDEVLLVGHSLGATLALRVFADAFAADPAFGHGRTRVRFLTCGAVIPKFALHPGAGQIRAEAVAVAERPGLFWCEYQSRHDAINFYKYHPVKLCRAEFDRAEYGQPRLKNANLKQMISRQKLKRLRWQIMRLHYQCMLANEMKAPYDFFMIALGPVPFAELCLSPDGPISLFGADGALLARHIATDPS